MSSVRKALEIARRGEWGRLFDAVGSSLPRAILFWDIQHIYMCTEMRFPAFLPRNAQIREALPEDADLLRSLRHPLDNAVTPFHLDVDERFAVGDKGYLLRVGEKPAGFFWRALPRSRHLTNSGYVFELPELFSWYYDIYIIPEYRGRGIFPVVIKAMRDIDEKIGISHICAEVHKTNNGSIKAHKRMGYRLVESVRIFNFFGLHLYIARKVSNKRPNITLRFYPIFSRSFSPMGIRKHVDSA